MSVVVHHPLTISCIGHSNIDIRTLKSKWYEFAAVTNGIMFTLDLNKIYSEERHEIYDKHFYHVHCTKTALITSRSERK